MKKHSKLLKFKAIVFLLLVFLVNCKKKEGANPDASLFVIEASVPKQNLPLTSGSIEVEIKSSYTKWLIAMEENPSPVAITQIYPSSGGSEGEETTTKVKISYSSNDDYPIKERKFIVKAINKNIASYFTITQSGKVVEPINISLNHASKYQTIAGFGGANSIWGTDNLNAAELKAAFGTGDGDLGLSMMRIRLSPNQADWSGLVSTLIEAKKYNITILASPWSPPANFKDNNSLVKGSLLESNYLAYANYLNDFVKYMAGNGVTIDAVSIQNEPDWHPDYEGCAWTPAQVFNFIKNYGDIIKGTKLVAAESLNSNQDFTIPILIDPLAVANLDVIGGHIYGGGLKPFPLAEQKGKEVWMTEYLLNQNSGGNPRNWDKSEKAIWKESMEMLGTVHSAMTSNWNAYIWWYIRRYYSFLGDGEFETTKGKILKRGLAMSQFAKFVRPGYVRIATQSDNPSSKLKITAYIGDNKTVIVIINPDNFDVNSLSFSLSKSIASALTYTTSEFQDCVVASITPNDKKATIAIKANSVTTLVMN